MRKKLSAVEKMIEKYGRKGSLPKSDRISLVHDGEYIGERIPFYNSPPEEEEAVLEGEKGKKKEKKLAYPSNQQFGVDLLHGV